MRSNASEVTMPSRDRNADSLPDLPDWLKKYNVSVGPYDQPVAPVPPIREPVQERPPKQPVRTDDSPSKRR